MRDGQVRLTAFNTHNAYIRKIPQHVGVQFEPRHISPTHRLSLWEGYCDAQLGQVCKVSRTGQLIGLGQRNRHAITK